MIDDRYVSIGDMISDKYGYDSNIRHLLYVIIPGFVRKYGVSRERMILGVFGSVRIVPSFLEDKVVSAYYSSVPKYCDGKIVTEKVIVINNYNDCNLVSLLDNLVHEFNHAINSYNNEVRICDNKVYLRTGLTWAIYDEGSLSPLGKDEGYVLEEIINTKQTEEIIDIIKGYDSDNEVVHNTVYAINNETSSSYNSRAYFLEGFICKKILENKTFLSTLSNLRFTGDVYEIDRWFDSVVGIDGSYLKLGKYLQEIMKLENELRFRVFFKKFIINKIRSLSSLVMEIVDSFNNNSH